MNSGTIPIRSQVPPHPRSPQILTNDTRSGLVRISHEHNLSDMAISMTLHKHIHVPHLGSPPIPNFPTIQRIHPPPQDRTMPPPISIIPQSQSRKRKMLPQPADEPSTSKLSSPSSAPLSSPDPDDEYAPTRGKRKATGKGGGSRPVSREALRKANHSLIERRRREKINFALNELRGMVPGLGDEGSGKGGEFKLEVSDLIAYPNDPLMTDRYWRGR